MDADEPSDLDEVVFAGVARQAELIRAGAISSVELTTALLERIARLDPALRAFRVVWPEAALDAARAADRARRDGSADAGPLAGVPIAVKDELDVAGQVTTYGTGANSLPARADAEPVRRLREAGAIIVGKTLMPEFGQWPFTESSTFGQTRNPWNPVYSPGGSSGGTAAAVAAGLVGAGLGSDSGGSIRIPAACCGLFGLKPQRGRVSTAPRPDLWQSLGTIGPLTRTVADSALLYDVISGSLPSDRWRADDPPSSFGAAVASPPGHLRVAVADASPARGVRTAPEHLRAVERVAGWLRELGHEVRDVDPRYPDVTAAFGPQFYGGVRDEAALVERPELLERRTRQTLRVARALPEGAVAWAVRQGERISARVNGPDGVFERADVLLTPALAARPRRVGALDGAGSARASVLALPYIAYTAIWNVCGNPAASLPVGFAGDGLPLAVQLVARPHDEVTLLRLAAQLERAHPWAGARPGLG